MDDVTKKTPEELLALVESTEDKEVLRFVANELEVPFSGNTGVGTLKEKLIPILLEKVENQPVNDDDENEDEDQADPVLMAALAAKQNEPKTDAPKAKKSVLDLPRTAQAQLNPSAPGLTEVEKRAIVRAKAMRLHRVRVHNLDPQDSAVPGAIKTVYNKYCGKVSKYIPYGEENEYGYHIPEILLNALREEKYTMRKEVKQRGQVSSFGVKQYKTVLMPKFNIEMLPPLTKEEIAGLAQDQKARGAIDAHE
ncbi:N4 gp55-like protein [Silicibacter phage DSS3phi2]|uniref:N4 gp55-like protein n=1 Tax=Silicibacter phage DSS3phi2 TaxID=490912 RepID=C4NT67_9CAUD|nr:N4 gp55-like protein [Silicibacter phage DSS3phi2]ACL81333.1 N4 gp55-like protein [Silicibacter phage DSS3phi2]